MDPPLPQCIPLRRKKDTSSKESFLWLSEEQMVQNIGILLLGSGFPGLLSGVQMSF